MANKFLDSNGVLYLWSKIKGAFVSKETGKGLSSNDFTTDEKNKLNGISANAQVNVLEKISVNGVAQTVSQKGVNITVPTTVAALSDAGNYAKKSDLTNVYKYKGSVSTFSNLPTNATAGDVYNVESDNMNYAWDGDKWDPLGALFTIETITNAEIDAIVAS